MSDLTDASILRTIADEITKIGGDISNMTASQSLRVFGPAFALATLAESSGAPLSTTATLFTGAAVQGMSAVIERNRAVRPADRNTVIDQFRQGALGYAAGGGLLWLLGSCGPMSDTQCDRGDALTVAMTATGALQLLLCGGFKDVQTRARATLALPADASADDLYDTLTGA